MKMMKNTKMPKTGDIKEAKSLQLTKRSGLGQLGSIMRMKTCSTKSMPTSTLL